MSTFEMITFIITFTYGVTFGLSNTYHRIRSVVLNLAYRQDDLGMILDFIWYALIAFFLIKSFQ